MPDLINWRDLGSVMRWCHEEAPLVRMVIAWDKKEGCYKMCPFGNGIHDFVGRGYNIVAFIGGSIGEEQKETNTA